MPRPAILGRNRRVIVLAISGWLAAGIGLPPVGAAAGSSASSAGDRIGPAAPGTTARVIVRFRGRPGQAGRETVAAAGGRVTRTLGLIDGLAVSLPPAAIDRLRRSPRVESVELDGTITAFADPSTGDLEYDNAWGVRHIGTYPVHQAGIRGAGVRVAVIDTGLDYLHDQPPSAEPPVVDPEFLGNYRGGYDFVNNDADPMDDNGHGTHVTGILAAEHNGYLVVGVAPAVELYALKVLGASGSGDYSGLIAALGWAVDHDIDVVNISLGGHDVSAALQAAVSAAYQAGVTIVAASGNTVTFQEILYGCPVAYPAAYPEVIAVSFTGTADRLTGYSCTGPQVDLAAPGDQIASTVPVGSCMFCSPNGYSFQSGTSMASPHVAGLAALILGYGIADANHDGLLADDVKAHLCATAATATYPAKTDSRYPKWYGCGIIDARKALLDVPPPGGGSLNRPPVAGPDAIDWVEDGGSITIDVLANDGDPDPGTVLSVSGLTDPPKGTASVDPGGGSVTYLPDPNANGVDSFSYTVVDGDGGSATGLVTVTVTPVNDPPEALDDLLVTVRDVPADLAVLANDGDVDGDPLTVTTVGDPSHGTVAIQVDGSVRYGPAADYSGPDAFDYTITDGAGGSATGHVTVSVLAVDHPPLAADDELSTDEDAPGAVAVLANDTDPDGETPAVVGIVAGPSHGSAALGPDDQVTYTPDPDYHGPDQFRYRIADGAGLTDEANVEVTVRPVNDDPVAGDDSATTAEDEPVTIAVLDNDSDIDGDALSVTAVSQPVGGGTVTIMADGRVRYTPGQDLYGGDQFDYTISDGAGGTATASVDLTVTPVNDPPAAAAKSVSTAFQTATTITLTGNDVETCDLTFQIVSSPQHGSLGAISNQLCVTLLPPYADSAKVTYTPANGYSGADSFTYRTSDGTATSAPATVSITVGPQLIIHVGDLDRSPSGGSKAWTARVSILVHNGAEGPTGGVTVSGTWSAGASGTVTCKTASSGWCTVSKTGIANAIGSVTFTVTGLSLKNAGYGSGANHDPDGDSTGTAIVIPRP